MFRFLFAAAALMVLGAVLFGTIGAVAGLGLLLLTPFVFLAKIALFFMFFVLIARACGFRGGPRRRGARKAWWDEIERRGAGRPPWTRPAPEEHSSVEDRFEEWHRMAHAREEVEGWTAGLDDPGHNA